jgi:antitoxin (DNA-binding transcriptional repressor) of toxin-antitoxin stability system
MKLISVFDAKTNLSKVLEELSSGRAPGFIVTRHGKAIARLVPEPESIASCRIGIAKGSFAVPDSLEAHAEEAAALFGTTMEDEP